MQIRVPKSIVFGAERAEKSQYKRKIPCDISLGARCRRFKSCHSDQNRTPILIQCVLKRVSGLCVKLYNFIIKFFQIIFQKVPTFSDSRVYMDEGFQEEKTSEQTRCRENHN